MIKLKSSHRKGSSLLSSHYWWQSSCPFPCAGSGAPWSPATANPAQNESSKKWTVHCWVSKRCSRVKASTGAEQELQAGGDCRAMPPAAAHEAQVLPFCALHLNSWAAAQFKAQQLPVCEAELETATKHLLRLLPSLNRSSGHRWSKTFPQPRQRPRQICRMTRAETQPWRERPPYSPDPDPTGRGPHPRKG